MAQRVIPFVLSITLLGAALAVVSPIRAAGAAFPLAAEDAPALKLVARVVNEAGGARVPDDWILSATAAAPNDGRNFRFKGGSGAFHAVYADTAYVLAETGPADYVAGAWSCSGGSLAGSTLTLGQGAASVVCTVTNAQSTGKIAPAAATCRDFMNGSAGDLSRALYAVRRGAVSSVAPGAFTYYDRLPAMPASFTIQVKQTQSPVLSWPWLPPQTMNQVVLYDASCSKSRAQGATAYDPATGAITMRVSGTAGATYVLGVRYNPAAVKRASVSAPYPQVTVRFVTWVDGSVLIGSQEDLDLVFKK